MSCVICGSLDAELLQLTNIYGELTGAYVEACPEDCAALAFMPKPLNSDEEAVHAWEVRKVRAKKLGKPFKEPPPRSKTELEVDRWLAERGLLP